MIPVTEQPEPTQQTGGYDFHHDVCERGEDAIRQLAGLPPLRRWPGPNIRKKVDSIGAVTPKMLRKTHCWTRSMDALHHAYKGYCAYHARFIERVDTPTTDHFVALRATDSTDLMLAYTWSNYRLASGYINGVKSNLSTVLDPFTIGEGWFALDLGTFKTIVGPNAPLDRVADIEETITLLHLDRGPIVLCRRRAAERYWAPPAGLPPIPFWSLALDQPFLSAELRRQNRLNPGD